MPRRPRLLLDDLPLHLVERGHNREPCFFAEENDSGLPGLQVAAAGQTVGVGDAAPQAADRVLALTLAQPVNVDTTLGLQWGQGWGIERSDAGPTPWQWGSNDGFLAFAMVAVGSRDGFVILTNHDRGMPLAAVLAHSVLPGNLRAFEFSLLR